MSEFNGWKNYETWNVALWIFNEEQRYRTMREEWMRDHDEIGVLCACFPSGETPDGVRTELADLASLRRAFEEDCEEQPVTAKDEASEERTEIYHLEAGGFIEMPEQCWRDLTRSGEMSEVAAYWERQPTVKFACDDDAMRKELKSAGIEPWAVDAMNATKVRRYALWIAAGHVEMYGEDNDCDAEEVK